MDCTLKGSLTSQLHDFSLCQTNAIISNTTTVFLFTGRPYCGKPSDMWALGVVLFTMLYGQFPFYDSIPQELFRKIKAAEYSIPEWVFSPGDSFKWTGSWSVTVWILFAQALVDFMWPVVFLCVLLSLLTETVVCLRTPCASFESSWC